MRLTWLIGAVAASAVFALAANPTTNAATPAPVVAISNGPGNSCALTTDGAVYCWGRNDDGQTNPQHPLHDQPTPVLIGGLSPVSEVAIGGINACAL